MSSNTVVELSEDDVHKQARLELLSLQRQYRLLEDQRHGFSHVGGSTARKQLCMIQLLKEEKEDISSNLRNATCAMYKRKAKNAEATILEFIKRYEMYKDKIQKHLKEIKELGDEGDRIQIQVVQQKLKILSFHGLQIHQSEWEKKIQILENKLYHVTSKFDQKCSENRSLRNEIAFFLNARTTFHKRHNYLKMEIVQEKNKMLQLVQNAAFTYDNRDEAVTRTKMLRERDSKESKQHVLEVKEYQRVIHHDQKIHDFLHVKNHTRRVLEDDEERRVRKEIETESELDRVLKQYRKSVAAILKMTASNSVDRLCSEYEDLEHKNLAFFKFITDLNHECEVLKDAVVRLQRDIESSQNVISQRRHKQHSELKLIQSKVIAGEGTLRNLNKMADSNLTKLSQLVSSISEFFELGKCSADDDLLKGILGNQTGVTPRNAELCISILDHRITNLQYNKRILEYRRKTIDNDVHKITHRKSMFLHGLTIPVNHGGPFKAEILVQNHLGEGADEDDADKAMGERPYFYHEMRDFVLYQMIETGLIQPSEVPTSILNTISVATSEGIHGDSITLMERIVSRKNVRIGAQLVTTATNDDNSENLTPKSNSHISL